MVEKIEDSRLSVNIGSANVTVDAAALKHSKQSLQVKYKYGQPAQELTKGLDYPSHQAYDISAVPLYRISTNTKQFQNRKKEYSENSVQSIITAVLSGTFLIQMLDPIKCRKDPETNILYILSGHSRYEAFRRLSSEPLCSDPRVIEFLQDKLYSFDNIPCITFEDMTLEDATFVALLSNTLSSSETDAERAYFYRQMRQLQKRSPKEIEAMGKLHEKDNWNRISALSHLNPNGHTIQYIENFELGLEVSNDIKKISYRIGRLRKELPELSNLHENEIVDWLFLKKGYGTRSEQVSRYEQCKELVCSRIALLKESESFAPDKPLNIADLKSVPPAMQEFYKLLKDLKEKQKGAMNNFHSIRRDANKKIIGAVSNQQDIFVERSHKAFEEGREKLAQVEYFEIIEERLNGLKDTICDEKIEKVKEEYFKRIMEMDGEIHTLLAKRDQFTAAAEAQERLF